MMVGKQHAFWNDTFSGDILVSGGVKTQIPSWN